MIEALREGCPLDGTISDFSSSLFLLFNKMSTPALYEKRTDSRDSFWICVLRFIRDNSRTRNQR